MPTLASTRADIKALPFAVKLKMLDRLKRMNAQDAIDAANLRQYSQYQEDPVRFGREILKERYTRDVERMMESVRDNMYTIARSANATGKTHGGARVAVWWYTCFDPCQVYTFAAPPEDNLKRLLWGEIGHILERHPELFRGSTLNNLWVARAALTFLTGVTIPTSGTEAQRQAKFSGKHSPNLLFIGDEVDAVPNEVFDGMETCLSGGKGRFLGFFNPRHKSGPIYRMEADHQAHVVQLSAFSHPNVVTGREEIPGAVTREKTVQRINEWTRPLGEDEVPTHHDFELPEFLVGETAGMKRGGGETYPPLKAGKYRVTDNQFFIVTLGEYAPQSSQQLISEEWIMAARERNDRYIAEHGENGAMRSNRIMGIDNAEQGTDSNCVCFRYPDIPYMPQIQTWQSMDADMNATIAAEKYREGGRTLYAVVDGIGIGANVAPAMVRQGTTAYKVNVSEAPTEDLVDGDGRVRARFYRVREQLYWALREWLRTDENAALPDDALLLEELQCVEYEFDPVLKVTRKKEMKKLLKRSPDRMESLLMTMFKPSLFYPALG